MFDIQIYSITKETSVSKIPIYSIPDTALTVLIGKNNSGKTNFLRKLAGLERYSTSQMSVRFYGNEVVAMPEHILRSQIGFLPSVPVILPMSLWENLLFGYKVNKQKETRQSYIDRLFYYAELLHVKSFIEQNSDSSLNNHSLYIQQLIVLLRSLILEPRCLVIDEPTYQFDTVETSMFEEQLLRLKSALPIILATHNPSLTLRVADNVLFFHDRTIIEQGLTKEVIFHPQQDITKEYFTPIWERFALLSELDVKRNEVENANMLLREQIAEKDRILHIVSHDIRSPLASIMGIADLLENGIEAEEPNIVREYSSTIHKTCHSLLSLVNDILLVAALDTGKRTLNEDAFEVRETLMEAVDMLTMLAIRKGVKVQTQYPSIEFWTYSDRPKMLQIFINILSNAIKFTPEGGTVSATLTVENDENFSVVIQDTGVGMTSEQIEQLFIRFGSHKTGTAGEQGNGLGMSIVKSLIDLLCGSLQVQSTINIGTTITVALPINKAENIEVIS